MLGQSLGVVPSRTAEQDTLSNSPRIMETSTCAICGERQRLQAGSGIFKIEPLRCSRATGISSVLMWESFDSLPWSDLGVKCEARKIGSFVTLKHCVVHIFVICNAMHKISDCNTDIQFCSATGKDIHPAGKAHWTRGLRAGCGGHLANSVCSAGGSIA